MKKTVPVREPRQKRSIEKKEKIIQAGFELFCERGYQNTNTNEIAERAGVSIGTLYSYFEDKKSIFMVSFQLFLNTHLEPLLEELAKIPQPADVRVFVTKCIEVLENLYISSKNIIYELGTMQEADPEIMQFFAEYEDTLLSSFVKTLDRLGVSKNNLNEKMYLLYTTADALGQEAANHYHHSIKLEPLREVAINMLTHMLIASE